MAINIKINPIEPAYRQVERSLRRLIQTGKTQAMARLPTTAELAIEWGVSRNTAQKALKALKEEGLLERNTKKGTFVKRDNGKGVVGILIGANLMSEDAYFYRALTHEIRQAAGSHNWTCRVYDQLSDGKSREAAETKAHLLSDLTNHAFKGMIWIGFPSEDVTRAVLTSHLPRVMFGAASGQGSVDIDLKSYVSSAVEYAVGEGRKKIMYLRTHHIVPGYQWDIDGFREASAKSRLTQKDMWICPVKGIAAMKRDTGAYAYKQMNLEIEQWRAKGIKPDAIIVPDDITMRGGGHALAEHKIKVPEETLVICMTNKGINHSYDVPVVKYEVSVAGIVKVLIETFLEQMDGKNAGEWPRWIKGKFSG